jgi:EAL domain-containing protein (putative c-di-GMP-specific phosphodiesterase class I)
MDDKGLGCRGCRTAMEPFAFTFAFQPIVDVKQGCIFSYEALVRGPNGESAASVLDRVDEKTQYAFDQACRVNAMTLASRLGIDVKLNINFLPNAIYQPALCIRSTLAAAARLAFPIERIVFEVTEGESIADHAKLVDVFREYRRLGFKTAIDDFGAGYAGLGLLADFQPDFIKLDMKLVRDVPHDRTKQAITRAVAAMCAELDIALIAEGVETRDEFCWLHELGIELFQGYLFARPAFEALPAIALDDAALNAGFGMAERLTA